jgi:VanZ family protein
LLRLTDKVRSWGLVALTIILALIILFLVYTSEEPRWGGGYWENWLINHFFLGRNLAGKLVIGVRKTMHFFGYGVTGLLFWLYFYLWRLKKAVWLSWAAIIVVACLDEYLQSLTTFRTGKPTDVMLDICGALVITGLVKLYFQKS